MMRKIILIFLAIVFFSCEEKKTDFIQSAAITNLFLIENHSMTKSELMMFYKYTSNTEDFLKSEIPGGYFREYLDNYPEDELVVFTISKCENHTTQLVGRLYYYGLKGSSDGIRETDTIIYKCN